jgi:hypothetical protein
MKTALDVWNLDGFVTTEEAGRIHATYELS